ncbi:helix-turn-helix transcriptional regulator [Mucilaginibacter sp. CAU 1740]|uniref:helix-turn-helix transcriptional regulator n=1 Tax=Mucilaginibacter sp. CAU 1740 TaxID=3140365 RepID=UPI00325ACEE2
MNTNADTSKNIHQGRNIKRFREMLGLKQEALAYALGEQWSQKRVSLLEQKEVIEDDILNQVAAILKVPVDAIKNLDEDKAVNIIANTFTDFKDNASAINTNCSLHFNPIEKIVSLYDEKVALLERLLESEREKVEMLRKGNG